MNKKYFFSTSFNWRLYFRTFGAIIVAFLLLSQSGCMLKSGCDKCSPPDEAISEMAVLGATLSSDYRPFPESSVDQFVVSNGENGYINAALTLYFAPHPDFSVVDDPAGLLDDWSTYPYEYTYSVEESGIYLEVPASTEYQASDASPKNFYTSNMKRDRGFPDEFLGDGNHILKAKRYFSVPTKATHVELWYRRSPDAERELVRRVALNRFFAWNRYIKPLVDQQMLPGGG